VIIGTTIHELSKHNLPELSAEVSFEELSWSVR
jgi:hypothetical protein